MHYSNWDEEETKEHTKKVLKSYHHLKVERAHLSVKTSLSGINYDGMPKSTTNRNGTEDALIDEIARVEKQRAYLTHEIAMIDATIKTLRDIDEQEDYYATLLDYRFLRHYSVTKCCRLLGELDYNADHYHGSPVPKQTFNDHQSEAVLAFAEIYPDRSRVVVENSPQKSSD